MNVFEAVKQNLTTRQAAELYCIPVNRHGMAVCPFHNDKKCFYHSIFCYSYYCYACFNDLLPLCYKARITTERSIKKYV